MGSGQNRTETDGSSSTESSSLTTGLRFGRKIYFEDGSGSGLSKNRGRKSTTTAMCQVEGCRVDLSNAKRYYSRHKVCCIHSKSSKVIVSGLLQRFCQQCSRSFATFSFFLFFYYFWAFFLFAFVTLNVFKESYYKTLQLVIMWYCFRKKSYYVILSLVYGEVK